MSALETLLRIKGYATPQVLADVSGLETMAVDAWCERQIAAGFADTTRMGLRLTPAGRDAADAVTMAERAGIESASFEHMYENFEALNGPFKKLIAAWQVRLVNGAEAINDHNDAEYDAAIMRELSDIHDGIAPVLTAATAQVARLRHYQVRFDLALATLKTGNLRFMAAPIIDSYHTIWFELHEDLIRLSGRSRAAEALAGRAS
jgi:pyruvate, orthophosphate dikinase